MPKRLFAVIAAVLWLFLTGMLVAHAQSPVTPQVLGVVSHPGAESLGLDVYFVVTDADGRPILRPNLDEATIQLVGSASAPVPATVGDPQSDIYVVLLLDTSGSMRNTIGLVHEAASSALESSATQRPGFGDQVRRSHPAIDRFYRRLGGCAERNQPSARRRTRHLPVRRRVGCHRPAGSGCSAASRSPCTHPVYRRSGPTQR